MQTQLRELENVEAQLLERVYDYKEQEDREQEEQAKEVTFEFKQERMDPRRPLIKWERVIATKKRNEIAKQTKMISLIKGFD